MDDDIFEISDSTFDDEIIEQDSSIKLVYFYFSWSASCREDLDLLSELQEEYKEKVQFFRLDIDKCPRISSRYSIHSEPAIIMFFKGDDIKKLGGDINETEVRLELDDLTKNIKKTEKKLKSELKPEKIKEIKIPSKKQIAKIIKKNKDKKDEKKNNHRRKLENESKLRRRNKTGSRNKK